MLQFKGTIALLLSVSILALTNAGVITSPKAVGEKAKQEWWRTASFYQIYPRSFKDSNGDGVGDLNGITEKLPYLKEIGIAAVWLSPIFASPMADFGYDISNFTKIDEIFGSMEDFDAMIKKAKEVGVKIILDFVPNHSSDECEWFQKSAERDPEFEDFYVWHKGKMIDGKRHPPNNWVSIFRGSAWQWNEKRQEYYLHQFVAKQPDLNYRNPKVRSYMNEILRFWLNKGVAGFRCDAVPNVFEVAPDKNGDYPDEPVNPWATDPDDHGYLNHIYTADQPETIHLVYEWRKVLDDFTAEHGGDDKILMIETWSDIDIVMQYYGNATAEGAQMPFNFQLISRLTDKSNAHDYANTINLWMEKMPEGRTANWVLGNHDKNRVGTRLGTERIDLLNMMLMTLPGCSVTYQGEEIGMTDVWISWNDTVDPQACNAHESVYLEKSRDPCRSPFQWSDEKNAGFTQGSKTWLPVSDNYKNVNVKKERGVSYSHLNVYKQLHLLREDPVMKNGGAEVKAVDENVLAIRRFQANSYSYVILLNINNNIESVDLNSVFKDLSTVVEYVVVTQRSVRRVGDRVYADQILLLPNEAVVLRTSK